jgi:protoporphyrinogen/coproporphyrinogen III oxidase
VVRVHRHPSAMPQYEVGHLERLGMIRDRIAQHPGLAFCGNALSGVGIPDCIHSGEQAAEQVLESAGGQAKPSGPDSLSV